MAAAAPLQLHDFRVLKTIGKGSYGECVLARLRTASLAHLDLLKSDHDSAAANSGSETVVSKFVIKKIETRNLSARERKDTMTEVRVLSALQHPNIIHYAANFLDKRSRNLCIVMEYAAGGDLSDHLRARRKSGRGLFPESKVLSWFVQICLGVKHCHDRKVLHRDLKPQNIFLSATGEIKIGDFGIAKILNSTGELAKTAIGTPYYLSPEICQEKSYNHKSDVWSLGCILYEIATLKHAFDGRNMKLLVLKIVRGSHAQLPRHFSSETRRLVNDMLRRSAKARPSVNDMLQRRVLKEHIGDLLSDAQRQDEFSHTVIHGHRLNGKKNAGNQKPRVAAALRRVRATSRAAAKHDQKQRQHENFLIRQAKERMQAKRLAREKEKKLKKIKQENMRKQAQAILRKAKAHHQRRRKKERNPFGAARAPQASRGSNARGDARKPVPSMMPSNDIKEHSWEIQYMNQGGLQRDRVGALASPRIGSPPAGGAADEPSKLELFNRQWAYRRDEIFKLAGIQVRVSGDKTDNDHDDGDDGADVGDDEDVVGGSPVDAAAARVDEAAAAAAVADTSGGIDTITPHNHSDRQITRAQPETKGPPAPEMRKAKHEKGLAELRAMYLAERRKRELLPKPSLVVASPCPVLPQPAPSSPVSSPKSTAQTSSPPPPPSRSPVVRPNLPAAPIPKQVFDLAALRRRANEHVSETRRGKKNKIQKEKQKRKKKKRNVDADSKDASKEDMEVISKKTGDKGGAGVGARDKNLCVKSDPHVPPYLHRQRRNIQGKFRSQISRQINNEKIKFRNAAKKQAHGNSIEVQKRLQKQRNVRDAARRRMRKDIAKRSKLKKKPSQDLPISVMVPSKFASALDGAVARDESVIFLNAPVKSVEEVRQSSCKAQRDEDEASVDIEISFEDKSFGGQSDSDEDHNDEEEGTMPFDLPSWPRHFGKDDTLCVPFAIPTDDQSNVPESVLYL